MGRYAILIDGAFAIHKLTLPQKFPDHSKIMGLVNSITEDPKVADLNLLRTYFYHAKPATGRITNPINHQVTDLGKTSVYRNQTRLIEELELAEKVAVRLGETSDVLKWKLGRRAVENLEARVLDAQDLVPDIKQKGVDLRIGLDIARLSLKGIVDVIVAVTGDSDLVPAFKFARREGILVYLNHLGHGVKRELQVHVDGFIPHNPA